MMLELLFQAVALCTFSIVLRLNSPVYGQLIIFQIDIDDVYGRAFFLSAWDDDIILCKV